MKIKKVRSKKIYILAIAVGLLIVGGTGTYVYLSQKNSTSTDSAATDSFGKVDYSPATANDKAYNDKIKEDLGNAPVTPTPSDGSKASVKPTVVDANQYDSVVEVRAFVPNIVENGGQCTNTFTGPNGATLTETTAASADASTTRCANLSIDRAKFTVPGKWNVVVSYGSTSYEGSSEPAEFNVR